MGLEAIVKNVCRDEVVALSRGFLLYEKKDEAYIAIGRGLAIFLNSYNQRLKQSLNS